MASAFSKCQISQKWFLEREIFQQRWDFFCCSLLRTSVFLCRLALKTLPRDKIFWDLSLKNPYSFAKGLTEGMLPTPRLYRIFQVAVFLFFCLYNFPQSVTFEYLNHIDIFAGGFGRVLIGVQYLLEVIEGTIL